MESETPKTKKVKKNIYQKLVAFKANLKESGGKNQAKLLEEQECFVYYSDDIVNTGSCDAVEKKVSGEIVKTIQPLNYCKSTVHFVDIGSGEEITATSIAKENRSEGGTDACIKVSRANAFKALLGNMEFIKKPVETPVPADETQSPTPARTPSEPSGGVPKGFTKFDK